MKSTTKNLQANLPDNSYLWNKAMLGSFKKGIIAHRDGRPITACPYNDKRKPSGGLSWSRSFISAWEDGWKWSANGKA